MPRRKMIVLISIACVVAVAMSVLGSWFLLTRVDFSSLFDWGPFARLPSDARMIEDFNAHREQYAELLQMFQVDTSLNQVDNDRSDSSTIDDTRWKRYQTLMHELHVESISRSNLYGQAGVFFTVHDVGLGPSGSQNGFAYCLSKPSPLLADTADVGQDDPEAYHRIAGNWYVWLESW